MLVSASRLPIVMICAMLFLSPLSDVSVVAGNKKGLMERKNRQCQNNVPCFKLMTIMKATLKHIILPDCKGSGRGLRLGVQATFSVKCTILSNTYHTIHNGPFKVSCTLSLNQILHFQK